VKRVSVSRGAIPPGRRPRRTSNAGTGASRSTASREDPSPSSRQRSESPTTTTPAERAPAPAAAPSDAIRPTDGTDSLPYVVSALVLLAGLGVVAIAVPLTRRLRVSG
jgi:hypothetical protein